MSYKITEIERLVTIPKGSEIVTTIYNQEYISEYQVRNKTVNKKHYDTEIVVSFADLMTDIGTNTDYDIVLNDELILSVRDFELTYIKLKEGD